MGYFVSHTIVVSGWDYGVLRATWRTAKNMFEGTGHHVGNITPPASNSYRSYFIAPDGSKQGWDTSRYGWEARRKFIDYLCELPSAVDWVLVQFADERLNTCVLDSSNHYNPSRRYFGDWASKAPRPLPHSD